MVVCCAESLSRQKELLSTKEKEGKGKYSAGLKSRSYSCQCLRFSLTPSIVVRRKDQADTTAVMTSAEGLDATT